MTNTNFNTGDTSGDNNMAARSDEATRQLNSFLRGEISAAETYRMAIEKVSDADNSQAANLGLLREIQAEHGRAAQALRDRIRELGGEPSDSSGAGRLGQVHPRHRESVRRCVKSQEPQGR